MTDNTSPLQRRMSRSHSFGDLLDLGSSSEWATDANKKESPKISRQMILGSVIRSNTNASNNSKATTDDDDPNDGYIELDRLSNVETYTAVESYVAQSDICLGFNAGDCCVLLRKTDQKWWLVNIGGTEGWVPGSFWISSSKVSNKYNFSTYIHTYVYAHTHTYTHTHTHTHTHWLNFIEICAI